MAPEQTEHPDEVDHRADIYSLGVVFYQMLTGELPVGKFAAPSKKVVIDVRLDEVVLRALEKEPDLRYQQASEVKTVVETIAGTAAAPSIKRRGVIGIDADLQFSDRMRLRWNRAVPIVGARQGRAVIHWPGVLLWSAVLIVPTFLIIAALHDLLNGPEWLLGLLLVPIAYLAHRIRQFLHLPADQLTPLDDARSVGLARRIRAGVFLLATGCAVVGAASAAHLGHAVPGLLWMMAAIGFGVESYRHARPAVRPDGRMHKALRSVLVTVFVALLARAFVVEEFMVTGDAVAPEIPLGSRVFVYKLARTYSTGDIAVYHNPQGENRLARAVQAGPADGKLRVQRGVSGEPFELAMADVVGRVILNTRAGEDNSMPAMRMKPSAFSATLASGITVELLGVSANPSDQSAWWKPDGSPLPVRPYSHLGAWTIAYQNEAAREFALRLGHLPADPIGTEWRFEPSGSYAGGGPPVEGGKSRMNLRAVAVVVPTTQPQMTIHFGVAAGLWKTVGEAPGIGSESMSMEGAALIFSPAVEKDGKTTISISHDVMGKQVRVVAVDAREIEHPSGASRADSVGRLNQLTTEFAGLRLSEIRSFRFQSRPYEWVAFKDVAINPSPSSGESAATQTAPAAASFGPAIEVTLHDPRSAQAAAVNFDTGKTFALPEGAYEKGYEKWLDASEADVMVLTDSSDRILANIRGKRIGLHKIAPDAWEKLTAGEVLALAQKHPYSRDEINALAVFPNLPQTAVFQTPRGAVGLVQVIEANGQRYDTSPMALMEGKYPMTLILRYKLVRTRTETPAPQDPVQHHVAPTTQGNLSQDLRVVGTLSPMPNNPAKWQIVAPVDEADIVPVEVGQNVIVTLDAFPGRKFTGKVVRVATTPVKADNVVLYDTTIEVNEADPKFKLGMTANVSITLAHPEPPPPTTTAPATTTPAKITLQAAEAHFQRVTAMNKNGLVDYREVVQAKRDRDFAAAELTGDAEAAARVRAQFAEKDFDVVEKMYKAGLLGSDEYEKAKYVRDVARAQSPATSPTTAPATTRASATDRHKD